MPHNQPDKTILSPLPGQEVCDFCCSPDVKWSIECGLVEVGFVSTNDAWAACDTCIKLIKENQWVALRERSIETFRQTRPDVPAKFVRDFVGELHAQFRVKHGAISSYTKNVA